MYADDLKQYFSESQVKIILNEWPIIVSRCHYRNVDPCLVMAIRLAENGRDGRWFGVLSVKATTYEEQLDIVINSIQNFLSKRLSLSKISTPFVVNSRRLMLSRDAIDAFGSRWAPTSGVSEETKRLNQNWPKNVWELQRKLVTAFARGELAFPAV